MSSVSYMNLVKKGDKVKQYYKIMKLKRREKDYGINQMYRMWKRIFG